MAKKAAHWICQHASGPIKMRRLYARVESCFVPVGIARTASRCSGIRDCNSRVLWHFLMGCGVFSIVLIM